MVSYFWDLATNGIDKEWVAVYTPYHRWFLFMESNESLLFIPGNYQEMMEDYG